MTLSTMVEELLAHSAHIGHRTSRWNPNMKSYLYGEQNGVHIFDLEKTAECLTAALEFLKRVVQDGKKVLFVGTKPQAQNITEETAKHCSMPYITRKWIGGFFTNFPTVSRRILYLKNLKAEEKSGAFERYVKHEALAKRREIQKLEERFGGVADLERLPGAVFVVDAVHDALPIKEAHDMKIPIVAIADSNANPKNITYVIPANDDALQALRYLLTKAGETIIEAGKTPRNAPAAS